MVTATSFEFSIKHSKHKSNSEKSNGKRSIKTVRGTQGEVSNLLSDNTSCTFSPSYVIFFVIFYPIQIGLILFPF